MLSNVSRIGQKEFKYHNSVVNWVAKTFQGMLFKGVEFINYDTIRAATKRKYESGNVKQLLSDMNSWLDITVPMDDKRINKDLSDLIQVIDHSLQYWFNKLVQPIEIRSKENK